MLKSPLLKKYCGSAKKAQGPAKSRKGKECLGNTETEPTQELV